MQDSLRLLKIEKSDRKNKKLVAIFSNGKSIHFGDIRYEDYTIHKDPDRKQRYIDRHRKNEDWSDPTKPGTLSLYILWNKPNIEDSIRDFVKKFKL